MKSVLSSAASPTFTPGAANAGTLNFATAVASYGFQFGRLLGVINLTQNAILYTAGVSGYGGAWNSGTSVLTLAQATTGMGSGDTLEVIWDDPAPGVLATLAPPSVANAYLTSTLITNTSSTNATVVKSSAGVLGGLLISSIVGAGSLSFLKFYDKATAPIAGTDTPKITIGVNTNAQVPYYNLATTQGIKFSNGISYAVTSAVAASDTSNCAGSFVINVMYV